MKGYRADIDGIRAIAVGLVLAFHAFPEGVPGGYIGVDIFFVISGYLITGIILRNLERKRFSFLEFYARRIRRIFPALIVVLFACLAAGWVLLLPNEYTSLGLNTFGAAAFVSNLVLLAQTGYFDLSAAQKPLLHLWSLGIEEQFYILWPAVLVIAFRMRLTIWGLALALLAISFTWNIALNGSEADFYLPMPRAWELMVGAFLAARETARPVARGTHLRDALTVVGAALIAAALLLLDRNSAFPGWWALLPTAGTALIIAADGAWLNRTVLSSPILVGLGLISYPLYLWHWPLLSFANFSVPDGPSATGRIGIVACAVAAAAATYFLVEKPLRRPIVAH